ncbi:MAG: TIGR02584 family CRISPR-associated protein [Acidobacteria bacterium]|nr:TIGR02584 family CRISPR-associated protein [Acidobacteriota bacterium]
MTPRNQPREDTYHHILVAVAGQTPQIITETLYALMILRRPPLSISEIYIITTSIGASKARQMLLDPQQGQFFAFCREYGINPKSIAFDEHHIITIKQVEKDSSPGGAHQLGKDLDDIRTLHDNGALAQQVLGFIKQLTADPTNALHCSIAGGRKTMSAYLALALTLYGRTQDTLSHVLVSEQFESSPDFYFPPREPRLIPAMRGGRPVIVNTRDAHIELADIPFVRVREVPGKWFATMDRTVEELIQTIQRALDERRPPQPQLVVNLTQGVISYNSVPIKLQLYHLALYAFFAQVRKDSAGADKTSDWPPVGSIILKRFDAKQLAPFYQRVLAGNIGKFHDWLDRMKEKQAQEQWLDNVRACIAKINKKIEALQLPSDLKIAVQRKYSESAYGISLDPSLIEVIE